MQRKVVDWLCDLQSRRGILKAEERSLYKYAYRLLLSRILIYSIIVALGIITGNWLEMFSFLLPFVLLRQYAGGIHLKKFTSCIYASSFLVFVCGEYLATDLTMGISFWIVWFVSIVIIFLLSPVGTGSKKLSKLEKKVYGNRAKIILFIEVILALYFEVLGISMIFKGIMIAHIILACGLVLGSGNNFFTYRLDLTNKKQEENE